MPLEPSPLLPSSKKPKEKLITTQLRTGYLVAVSQYRSIGNASALSDVCFVSITTPFYWVLKQLFRIPVVRISPLFLLCV